MGDHGRHAPCVAGGEEQRHQAIRQRRDPGRKVAERGVDFAAEGTRSLQSRDPARRSRGEHRTAHVEREKELGVGAHGCRVGGPNRRLSGCGRHERRQGDEPYGAGQDARSARSPEIECRADARIRSLADRERGQRRDEGETDESGPGGQEDQVCERRHRLRTLPRLPVRARSGCAGSRRSAACGWSSSRDGPGSSSSVTWPGAGSRGRASRWRLPDPRGLRA